MSEQISTTFVLTGALKGDTVTLGSQNFSFVDGKMKLNASATDTEKLTRFLYNNWQAVPEQELPVEKPKKDKK